MRISTLLKLALVGTTALLVGCEGSLQKVIEDTLPERNAEYKSSRRLPPLEIPPDLASAGVGQTLVVPSSGEASARDLANARQPGQVGPVEVLPQQNDIRVERDGDKRWLVVSARPEQVWPRLRDFWTETGFLITVEDPSIGIIETDWAENRADIPKGVIESMLSKLSTSLYSAGTRDRFRARIERGDAPGTTEIYVSHRGAREVRASNNPDQGSTVFGSANEGYRWEPRPSDPELEAEMLTRMMSFFGMDREAATQRVASTRERAPRAHIVRDDAGSVTLALREDFSQAWRRTGLALDRVGFTVEDRDRSRGMYFVRYVDPIKAEEAKDTGILSKLKFWGDEKQPENEYLISLVGGDNTTQVVVLDKRGQREVSQTAARILGLLHDELK